MLSSIWPALVFSIIAEHSVAGFRLSVAHELSRRNVSRQDASHRNATSMKLSALPASSRWRQVHHSAGYRRAKPIADESGIAQKMASTANRTRNSSYVYKASSMASLTQKLLKDLAGRVAHSETVLRRADVQGWIAAVVFLCAICFCCASGEIIFREQDRRRKRRLQKATTEKVFDMEETENQYLSDGCSSTGMRAEISALGKEARGADDEDGYHFGDYTRGIIGRGKETRGADIHDGYRFGDFTRGLLHLPGPSASEKSNSPRH